MRGELAALLLACILAAGCVPAAQKAAASGTPAPPVVEYRADIVRWVDADTIVINIHLGLDVVLVDQRLRFSNINAPERGMPGHDELLHRFQEQCDGAEVTVRIHGRGKYGRWVGELYCGHELVGPPPD